MLPSERSILAVFCCFLAFISSAHAQTSLDLTDKLPPYLMSALLLNNGHFSVSTRYTGTSKTLIYKEDGTGNRPVNYTSHIHIKVDNTLFQLPFEVNPATDFPPPVNPMRILGLFRDTVAGRPRINARMLALMPGADSIMVIFTMEPVARPSGGFIRMSVGVENRGTTNHNIGVLILIDTKIGNNDRAPIATAFGYSGRETLYDKNTVQGIPDFWLALEGTPLAPGLAARGNLRETDLIVPDLFMFGNWVDDPANNVQGLYRVQFDERAPSNLAYTDSAILLLWRQQLMARGMRKILAATEIGVSDSLSVDSGDGGGGGGGGGNGDFLGIAGTGTCLSTDTLHEVPCGLPGYHPYKPDTLQALYLVTNTSSTTYNNIRLVSGPYTPGLLPVATTNLVINNQLAKDETGVGVVSVGLVPRLNSTTYGLPIAVVRGSADTVLRDTLCIVVPGLLGSIDAFDVSSPPTCPNTPDTTLVRVLSRGVRCLDITDVRVLPPGSTEVRVITPFPAKLAAATTSTIPLVVTPNGVGTRFVRVRIEVRDWESVVPGDTTFVVMADTITLTINGKLAELKPILPGDTLDLVKICINDTATDDVLYQNIGGCSVTILTATWFDDASGRFLPNPLVTSVIVPRGQRTQLPISFMSTTPGTFVGIWRLQTNGVPAVVDVPVRIVVDAPTVTVDPDTIDLDTVCPGTAVVRSIRLRNPTACIVAVDSAFSVGADSVGISPVGGFSISPNGAVSITTTVNRTASGPFNGRVRIRSVAGDVDVVVKGVAATRALTITPTPTLDLGDIRVGQAGTGTITIQSAGDAPVTIASIGVGGPQGNECAVTPQGGITLPHTLAIGASLVCDVTMTPSNIDIRRAIITVVGANGICTLPTPTDVRARGISPLLDIEPRILPLDATCIGGFVDTVITLVNRGNAPLQVTGIVDTNTASPVSTTATFPIVIDSGGRTTLPIRVQPSRLGGFTWIASFTSDGEWFTPADTTLRLDGTALLCASISLDTIEADIGTIVPVTIVMTSDVGNVTADQMRTLINDVGGQTVLRIQSDEPLLRMSTTVEGQLVGASAVTIPVPGGTGSLTETTITHNAPLAIDNTFGILRADVVLGSSTRTALTLFVDSLAGGHTRLNIHPGLVRARYCAIDNRFVQPTSQGLNAWFDTDNHDVRVHAKESGTYEVHVLDVVGRVVQTQRVTLEANTTQVFPLHSWIRPESQWHLLRVEKH